MQKTETIHHLLIQCEKVKPLWKNLEHMCKYWLNQSIELHDHLICLNNYSGPKKSICNTLIICMKHYIYSTKCLDETLNFNVFMSKLSDWYQMEKIHAFANNNIQPFYKKWQNIYY